jgi:transcriptional regulator with XRE-family HTH domain
VGQLLQDERARRLMSQAALAERAGTTQQRVSLIERGTAQPTTALLDRLFAVLNLQVRVEPEPLGAGQDGEIDKFARLTEDERVKWFRHYDRRFDQLGDLPYVLGGRLAAFLQGVPIGADRLDLVVAESDLDRFADWFERVYCHRWNERWGEYGGLSVDPREPGLPLRWMVGYDEVRLEIMPALPASVTVCCGGGCGYARLSTSNGSTPTSGGSCGGYGTEQPLQGRGDTPLPDQRVVLVAQLRRGGRTGMPGA